MDFKGRAGSVVFNLQYLGFALSEALVFKLRNFSGIDPDYLV
jgi:hypothetical protein